MQPPSLRISGEGYIGCHVPEGTVIVVKNPPAKAADTGDVGLIPGKGRSPEGGNGSPLQYSCLRNPMGRGSWQAAVHGSQRDGYD